ncbi:MAG: 30S ribosomal protein S18 [Candidatus Omnitrophica bacterium]|nr:30S ribosomal protein S18 [Candidatus Omnitrophota bacterium]
MIRRGAKKGERRKEDTRKDKNGKRPNEGRRYILRKKKCKFCTDKNLKIHYLDHQLLRRFITERGKIIPSRFSGSCARHQRKLAKAIKRARNIGILPFLAE